MHGALCFTKADRPDGLPREIHPNAIYPTAAIFRKLFSTFRSRKARASGLLIESLFKVIHPQTDPGPAGSL